MSRIARYRHAILFALAYGAIAGAVLFVRPGAGEAQAPAPEAVLSAPVR